MILEKIKNLPAKSFDKVIEHPAIELWCANIIRTVRHDEELEDDLFFEGLYFLQSILKVDDMDFVKQNNNYLKCGAGSRSHPTASLFPNGLNRCQSN